VPDGERAADDGPQVPKSHFHPHGLSFLAALAAMKKSYHAGGIRAKHRRRCIAIDLMGLGFTEISPSQDVSFTAQAHMIAEVLDALKIEKIDLVGNDSGGAIAQIFAAHYSNRLTSLVLTNCDGHDGWPPTQVLPLMEHCERARSPQCFSRS
jgi:pimeloyl-ACP methyl ester carboxylesterase